MHACSLTLLSERTGHTQVLHGGQGMGSSPQNLHPNTITTQRYVIMDTGIHPVGLSPGGCLLLNSELYGDGLYAMKSW